MNINELLDGRNLTPVDMVNISLHTWFYTSQLVQDCFHQLYIWIKGNHSHSTSKTYKIGNLIQNHVWMVFWLVVSTHLKNIRQMGNLPQTVVKINKYLKPTPSIGWSQIDLLLSKDRSEVKLEKTNEDKEVNTISTFSTKLCVWETGNTLPETNIAPWN